MKRIFLLTGLSLCLQAQAFDLWQAYVDAQENDPTYLAAKMQKGITDAQKKQARAAMLPTVVLTGTAYHTHDTFLNTGINTNTNPVVARIALNQPIIDVGSLTAFKQVKVNADSGDLKIAQAKQDFIIRVMQAYFSALLAQSNAKIAEAQRSASAKQVAIAKKLFEVGSASVIDKNEAEAAYYNAHAAEINAINNQKNAFAALEDMVGHSINEPLAALNAPLRLKMPVPDTESKWVERARQESYAVRIAQLSEQMSQLEIDRRNQQHLPKLDLVASQQWKHTNLNHSKDVSTRTSSVGLELSMPLFDGGLIGAQVEEARVLQQQSMQSLRGTQTSVAQATRAAYGQAVSGLASIEALEAAKKASAASVLANQKGLELGIRINVDLLNAQNTDAQTKYNMAQAQYNTILGNVNLKAAIAQLGVVDVRYINDLLAPTTVKEVAKVNVDTMVDPLPSKTAVIAPTNTNRKASQNK